MKDSVRLFIRHEDQRDSNDSIIISIKIAQQRIIPESYRATNLQPAMKCIVYICLSKIASSKAGGKSSVC